MERTQIEDSPNFIGKKIKVCGFINSRRDHGKLIFVDIRDISGILQVVFDFSLKNSRLADLTKKLSRESVVSIEGEIKKRPKGTGNVDIKTGEVEMAAENFEILSEAKVLPFPVDTPGYEVNEEARLKYRYLDLRRDRMKRNLKIRQRVIQSIRNFLQKEGFIEVETPILTKSTPEGARDFLVPSRLQAGRFYALPQSPQQYKQLLQVSGIEKYFQIARCFRDEDPRADRQAEFTQLDIEMSFVEQGDILDLIERLYTDIVKKLFPEKKITKVPFPRLTYKKVMDEYGTDKPDLRKNKGDQNELAFGFIIDFPMFEWKKEENRWDAVHHPFTRPQTEEVEEIKKNPGKILAHQYDFVLNGYEIGGGSLRSYKPAILEAIFEVMGHRKEEIKERFGHLLEAFKYGVPPHGGIAPGIDRFLSIILNEPNIREVIAFPKTGDNRDLMMEAPNEVDKKQLEELHIKTDLKKQPRSSSRA